MGTLPQMTTPVADPPRRSPRDREPLRRFIAEVAVVMIVLSFLTTMLVQTYVIPTPSMEKTLLVGDHLLVDKLAYSPHGPVTGALLPYRDVQRGDLIVFHWPIRPEQVFVKRVIGLPGDRIRMLDKAVYLNGRKLNEPYVSYTQGLDSYRDNFPAVDPYPGVPTETLEMFEKHVRNGELVVAEDCFFVMGDNRDLSTDSRFWGFVPRGNLIGKPLLVYWSFQASSAQLSSGPSVSYLWDVVTGFFSKTRWNRTGTLIHGYHLR